MLARRLSEALFLIAVLGSSLVLAGKPVGSLAGFGAQRTWSDKSGAFKISAAMEETDGTTVKLRKSSGDIVSVPLTRLSDADQAFVSTFLTAEKAIGGGSMQPDNPFEVAPDQSPASAAPAAAPSSETPAPASGDIPYRKVSSAPGKAVEISFEKVPWTASAVTPIRIAPQPNRSISLPMEKEFFAKMQLMVAGANPMAYVDVYRWDRAGKETYSHMGRVSMLDSKPVPVGSSDTAWKLLTVSKDARRIAAVKVGNAFDKGNDLTVFNMSTSGAAADYQFTAGEGSFGELHWAGFLSNNRLATISQKHTLTIWNLDGPRVIKQFKCKSLTARIGGNSELLALPAENRIALLDCSSFKVVGVVEVDGVGTPAFSFSPDGTRIATSMPYAVNVYSLTSGAMEHTIPVAVSKAVPVEWTDNEHLLLDRSLLVDIERNMAVWSYQMPGNSRAWGGSVYSVVSDRGGTALTVCKVPHADVESKLRNVSPSQLYALQEGAAYSLSLQLTGISPAQSQEIRNGIVAKLSANGWRESSGSSVKVTLKLEQGKSQEREYAKSNSRFPVPFGGTSGPSTKVSFRPWLHTISVTSGSEELFALNRTAGASYGVTMREGESIQQAVSRTVKPDPKFFTGAIIPAKIIKTQYRQGFGKSKIGKKGIE